MADTTNPAWRIFHVPYRVGVPEAYFYHSDWVSMFGRPTSGDKKTDKQLMNSFRIVLIPISEIVELWVLGAKIEFCNYKEDPYLAFKDINEHLDDWSRYLKSRKHSLNKMTDSSIPLEDLIKLAQFADALAPLTQDVDPSTLSSGRLTSYRTFARKRINNTNIAPPVEIKEDYQLNGSHIFMNTVLDPVAEPVTLTHEEKVAETKRIIRDSNKQSYTDILEEYMYRSEPTGE